MPAGCLKGALQLPKTPGVNTRIMGFNGIRPDLEAFLSETLGLTKLRRHLPTLSLAFLAFLIVHQILAPLASKKWFPVAYASRGRRARNNWSMHVVSQVHTVIIVPLALWTMAREMEERETDKAFGWHGDVGFLHAIACGYFLWDTLDAIINFVDLGFVVHGIVCFAIYVMTYRPFLAYYGTRCLLWEMCVAYTYPMTS